jgi:exodeoxyribonuclease VII large subunit
MENLFETQKIFSVRELNSAVAGAIKSYFPRAVWVCGEIQSLGEKNGISYFDLVQKDSDSSNKIIAQARSVMFGNIKASVMRKFKELDASLDIRNDIEVKLLCELDLYVPRGQFSLKILDVDPVYTLGKVAANRLKIIEDLKKRGLLDKNKLRILPLVPLNIGLITSFDSAAYHDFINELQTSGFGFKVFLKDCRMQGDQVEADVAKALDFFNRSGIELDAIVITRGGGSVSDLGWFDNKVIAETIAVNDFPVISAIGHQINLTITDLAAHTSLKTPTASAQFLVSRVQEFTQKLADLQKDILQEARTIIDDQNSGLQSMAIKVESLTSRYFRAQAEDLLDKKHILQSACQRIVMQDKQGLARVKDSLNNSTNKIFEKSKDKIKYLESKIGLLDPKNVLKRGFSLTLKDGRALKSVADVDIGSKIETVLYDGKVLSRVEEKSKL